MNAYLDFARQISTPMFRQQRGLLGFMVLHAGNTSKVLTFWPDWQSILEMENNEIYKNTVAALAITDFLAGNQTTAVFETVAFHKYC